jgi:hypothetical protein
MPSDSMILEMDSFHSITVARAALDQCNVSNVRGDRDSLSGKFGGDTLSWGSDVKVTATDAGPGRTKLTVTVLPGEQAFDWASARKEVAHLIAKIHEAATAQSPQR